MRRFSIGWKFVIGLFFVLSVGSTTFFLLQRKSFSSQNVHVVLENADNVASGSHATFRAGIQNDTNITLTNVSLALTLPDSMTIEGGSNHFAMLHWDTIGSNEKLLSDVFVSVAPDAGQGIVSGQVDYSPQGFIGRFVASQNFTIVPSPLGITSLFDLPSSAVSGQEIDGSLHIIPSDRIAANDLWIEFVPPQGFDLKEVSPQFDSLPTLPIGRQDGQTNSRWRIEGIQKGTEYVFRFRGIVHGSSGDEKNFQALFEEQQDGNFATLAQNTSGVHISQTMLTVTQIIDGLLAQQSGEHNVVKGGENLTIHLAYQNKSDTALEDVLLADSLQGSAWDFSSVSSNNGSWDASAKMITWDKNFVSSLALLQPGDSGEVVFHINVRSNVLPISSQDQNPTLVSDATISSPHQSLSLGGSAFEGEDTQTLKLQGNISLSASATLVSSSSQMNVYNVVWDARTTLNGISSVRVHATLAPGVVWQNVTSPPDALLSYADNNRTLVWNVGNLVAGTGVVSAVQKVSFQVSVPSTNLAQGQKIFTDQSIEGTNDFIGVHAQADEGALPVPGF